MMERPARFNADVRAFLQEEPGEREPRPQSSIVASSTRP